MQALFAHPRKRDLAEGEEGPDAQAHSADAYSLDGFVSGPNGELDWIFPDMDAEYAAWGVQRLWQAGAHVMGGATYRDMAARHVDATCVRNWEAELSRRPL